MRTAYEVYYSSTMLAGKIFQSLSMDLFDFCALIKLPYAFLLIPHLVRLCSSSRFLYTSQPFS